MKRTIDSISRPAGHRARPGQVGGRLIRQVVGQLKKHCTALPIDSHIHIAVSGGADSVALALLIAKYGRRIQPDLGKITFVHINHGWRGKESDLDAEFVAQFAQTLGVKCEIHELPRPTRAEKKAHSPEAWARRERKKIFSAHAQVWTAHHADDQVETLVWRLFSGQGLTHGGGILFRAGNELRPLLGVTRAELRAFLREEKQSWREDASNLDLRYLRNRVRGELLPMIESIFPRAREALLALAASATEKSGRNPDLQIEPLIPLFGLRSLGLAELGRAQILEISKHLAKNPNWEGEISLPKNWQLVRERSSQSRPREFAERWSVVLPKASK